MRNNAKDALTSCVYPSGDCSSMLRYASVSSQARSGLRDGPTVDSMGKKLLDVGMSGGNCSLVCPTFFECVHAALVNVSGRGRASRRACMQMPAGQICAARTRANFDRFYIGFNQGYGWTRSGHEGICFAYECLHCVVTEFRRYFECATQCHRSRESTECSDCSYNYEESHTDLVVLRERYACAWRLQSTFIPYARFHRLSRVRLASCNLPDQVVGGLLPWCLRRLHSGRHDQRQFYAMRRIWRCLWLHQNAVVRA